jgi:hypothetical protein
VKDDLIKRENNRRKEMLDFKKERHPSFLRCSKLLLASPRRAAMALSKLIAREPSLLISKSDFRTFYTIA